MMINPYLLLGAAIIYAQSALAEDLREGTQDIPPTPSVTPAASSRLLSPEALKKALQEGRKISFGDLAETIEEEPSSKKQSKDPSGETADQEMKKSTSQ